MLFRFKKIKEIIHICKETREKADELFQSVCAKAASLANKFDIAKRWSRSCGQQINSNIIPSETVKEYWKRSVHLPFLDVAFAEIKPRSGKKR